MEISKAYTDDINSEELKAKRERALKRVRANNKKKKTKDGWVTLGNGKMVLKIKKKPL